MCVVPSCPLLIRLEPHSMNWRIVVVRHRTCGPVRTAPQAMIRWGRVGGRSAGSDGEVWMAPLVHMDPAAGGNAGRDGPC